VLDPEAQGPLTTNDLAVCGHEAGTVPLGIFLKSDCYGRKVWVQVPYLTEQIFAARVPGIPAYNSNSTQKAKRRKTPRCGRYSAVVREVGSSYYEARRSCS